jgi:hypothetical protein
MLTKIRIQNFKQFDDVEIELGQTVVFIGPNNSGKTTALQALALWNAFFVKLAFELLQAHENKSIIPYHTVLNRNELTAVPVPRLSLLWRNLKLRNGETADIRITVEGMTISKETWVHSLLFRYVNEESVECIKLNREDEQLYDLLTKFAFLPPMSGLIDREDRLDRGSINRRLGEGRTAEVLRNLCYLLAEGAETKAYWDKIVEQIKQSFGVELLTPVYDAANGIIRMEYRDRNGITLDISSSGRGMLQVLLLLAYMYNNPGAVLLLDEPDAHLEILRQRAIYDLLTQVGSETNSQIIIASHSEVVLDTAASRKDTIIAFIGKPHRARKIAELRKSLDIIPTEDYYLAERNGWVLYTEGTTDLPILQAFAAHLNHPAQSYLQLVFNKDIENNEPKYVREHFTGLKEAYPDLRAISVFDRISGTKMQDIPSGLSIVIWRKREIENYLFIFEALLNYARAKGAPEGADERAKLMQSIIQNSLPPFAYNDLNDPWWVNTKVSEDYLERIFRAYAAQTGTPMLRKADFYLLVPFIPKDKIDPEVTEKLDAIVEVARQAKPYED